MPLFVDGVEWTRTKVRGSFDCPECGVVAGKKCVGDPSYEAGTLHVQRWSLAKATFEAEGKNAEFVDVYKKTPITPVVPPKKTSESLFKAAIQLPPGTGQRIDLLLQAVYYKLDENPLTK